MCIDSMRIFFDTSVLLDVFLKRAGEPDSSRVITACGQPGNEGFPAVHTLSNALHVFESRQTRQDAREFIRDVPARPPSRTGWFRARLRPQRSIDTHAAAPVLADGFLRAPAFKERSLTP